MTSILTEKAWNDFVESLSPRREFAAEEMVKTLMAIGEVALSRHEYDALKYLTGGIIMYEETATKHPDCKGEEDSYLYISESHYAAEDFVPDPIRFKINESRLYELLKACKNCTHICAGKMECRHGPPVSGGFPVVGPHEYCNRFILNYEIIRQIIDRAHKRIDAIIRDYMPSAIPAGSFEKLKKEIGDPGGVAVGIKEKDLASEPGKVVYTKEKPEDLEPEAGTEK